MVGDRIGHRTLLCVTRGIYALLAAALTLLIWSEALQAWHVFAIAAIAGLMRPSDMVMRHVLVGQTMRLDLLMRALGISRTTSDRARVAGAFAGTAGWRSSAWVRRTRSSLRCMSPLSCCRSAWRASPRMPPRAPLAGLKQGFRYVWTKPELLGAFALAFLVNLLAYPFLLGLLPYVAKDVFGSRTVRAGLARRLFLVGRDRGLVGGRRAASSGAQRA